MCCAFVLCFSCVCLVLCVLLLFVRVVCSCDLCCALMFCVGVACSCCVLVLCSRVVIYVLCSSVVFL